MLITYYFLLLLLVAMLTIVQNQCVITQSCSNRGQADSCDIPHPLLVAPSI